MARKRVVSRSIKTFIYTITAVNKETAEVFSDNFIVTGTPITNERKLEQLYNEAHPNNKFIDLTFCEVGIQAYRTVQVLPMHSRKASAGSVFPARDDINLPSVKIKKKRRKNYGKKKSRIKNN